MFLFYITMERNQFENFQLAFLLINLYYLKKKKKMFALKTSFRKNQEICLRR